MNKIVTIIIACLFSLMETSVFSQVKNDVIVTGTVYVSSSVSQGVMDGKTMTEGPNTFRNQAIYFVKDSITVKTLTDSAGVFFVILRPGTYIVEQEAGLRKKNPVLTILVSLLLM